MKLILTANWAKNLWLDRPQAFLILFKYIDIVLSYNLNTYIPYILMLKYLYNHKSAQPSTFIKEVSFCR